MCLVYSYYLLPYVEICASGLLVVSMFFCMVTFMIIYLLLEMWLGV